jgi:hypothetical protein
MGAMSMHLSLFFVSDISDPARNSEGESAVDIAANVSEQTRFRHRNIYLGRNSLKGRYQHPHVVISPLLRSSEPPFGKQFEVRLIYLVSLA